MVGLPMMIMGNQAVDINNRSVEQYIKRIIEREDLRKKELNLAEKWKEWSSLIVSVLVFSVNCSPGICALISSYFGLLARRYSAVSKAGRISMECTSA